MFSWVIPAFFAVVIVALLLRRFVVALPGKTRLHFLVGTSLLAVGAIGIELLEAMSANRTGFSLTTGMVVVLQEALEMAGALTFVYALLVYIDNTYGTVRFRFRNGF